MGEQGQKKQSLKQAREQKIVHANEIAQKPLYHLSKVKHCIWLYAISKIKSSDPPDKVYEIDLGEFFPLMRYKSDSDTNFKKYVQEMADYSFWYNESENDPNESDKLLRFFKNVEYKSRIMYFEFADEVKPYLFDLWERKIFYTSYQLKYILILKTYYAQRLYTLLKSVSNKTSFYFDIGSGESTDIFQILCSDITHLKKVPESWKDNFAVFRRDVLQPSVDDINDHTDLSVRFETLRKDRYENPTHEYSTIVFYIKEKSSKNAEKVNGYIDDVYEEFDVKYDKKRSRSEKKTSFINEDKIRELEELEAEETEIVPDDIINALDDTYEDIIDISPIEAKIEQYESTKKYVKRMLPEITKYDIYSILSEAERHIPPFIPQWIRGDWIDTYVATYTDIVINPSKKTSGRKPELLLTYCRNDYKKCAASVSATLIDMYHINTDNAENKKTTSNGMERDYNFEELEKILVDN